MTKPLSLPDIEALERELLHSVDRSKREFAHMRIQPHQLAELLRLARAGIWAQRHAIPTLRFYSEACAVVPEQYSKATQEHMMRESMEPARRALAEAREWLAKHGGGK